MRGRWIVLNFEHPMFGTREIGSCRFKVIARLRAWVFETFEGVTAWPKAWVIRGH